MYNKEMAAPFDYLRYVIFQELILKIMYWHYIKFFVKIWLLTLLKWSPMAVTVGAIFFSQKIPLKNADF